jgi:pyrroline-5-carboxylate reductase
MNVAFIGLGNMGSNIAQCILKAGFDLTVWNRTVSKMQPIWASSLLRSDLGFRYTHRVEVSPDCAFLAQPDAQTNLLPQGTIAARGIKD